MMWAIACLGNQSLKINIDNCPILNNFVRNRILNHYSSLLRESKRPISQVAYFFMLILKESLQSSFKEPDQ